jgi:hypothetical protein
LRSSVATSLYPLPPPLRRRPFVLSIPDLPIIHIRYARDMFFLVGCWGGDLRELLWHNR